MRALEHLRRAGFLVTSSDPSPEADALVTITADGLERTFAVQKKRRAPYPTEIPTLAPQLIELSQHGAPLLVAPYISEGTGGVLNDYGWSWVDEAGNFSVRSRGLRLRQRVTGSPPQQPRRFLPQGSGALTIIRFLISQTDPATAVGPGTTALARIASISQPRASQVLTHLLKAGLVERSGRGWYASDREELLDAFLNEYRGPGGSEYCYYSLDSPLQAALAVVARIDPSSKNFAVSADVGPDLVAPWRSPTQVIIYLDEALDLASLDLVEAQGRADATLLLRIPNDKSVFRSPRLDADILDASIRLADEAQMIWDLHDLGGDDRVEAAGELKKWLLNPR